MLLPSRIVTFVLVLELLKSVFLALPCPCFVSLLYHDLYVLGDGALVGWGSFMRTRCLCVLVHVWIGVGLAPLDRFGPSGEMFYWPFRGGASFVGLLCFSSVLCLLCLCARLFVRALWSPAGGGGGGGGGCWPLGSRLWCLL